MKTQRLATFALGSLLCACSLDVPDLNNPGLAELEENPTAIQVEGACTGLVIGNRRNVANENGYISQLGILGREAFNFDAADPRYINELLAGRLSQGSPFGGNFWGLPYGNIRLASIVLHALDKVSSSELDDDNKTAIRGFVNTIQALDLLEVINTHDTNGAVIDTDKEIVLPPATQPLGDIVGKDATFARIVALLDDAAGDLTTAAAGFGPKQKFPFAMSPGYAGNFTVQFDTPAGFLKFNRAIRARVAVYTKDYATALTALAASFIQDDPTKTIDFTLGVYHTFSTKTGDNANALINPNIYAHPSLTTDVEKQADGSDDARYTAKVIPIPEGEKAGTGGKMLESSTRLGVYPTAASPVTIIRNEELILLKAEALFFTEDVAGAIAELNIVREGSGQLDPLTGTPTEATFIDKLLYERRYSLLYEGHRWIDLRRFGRTEDLVLDDPAYKRNIRYPIPLAECNARPGEAACTLSSQ